MVVELRDRMANIEGLHLKAGSTDSGDSRSQSRADALAALEALGIQPSCGREKYQEGAKESARCADC